MTGALYVGDVLHRRLRPASHSLKYGVYMLHADLDRFLQRARTHTFSLSAMAFQDVWNLDLERLRGCCIHVVAPSGNLIPFCAYNLTSNQGRPLYRRARQS